MVKRILAGGAGEAEVLSISIDGPLVEIPDAHLLFSGQFSRSGSDLVIVGEDGQTIIIVGYFASEEPPILTADGAWLTADVVEALAGPLAPGQYAQAGTSDAPTGAAPIGQVETLTGRATATRTDGTVVELKVGDKVFKGDVVATEDGASLGIVFLDETVFTLSPGSRMVLNELVYQPGGNDNSMLMNLVQGTFVFVAGKVAPSGDMKIDTPVATMGIRGTTGIINIKLVDGSAEISGAVPETTFKIAPDPDDGAVGSYQLFDKASGALLGTVEDTGTKLIITEVGGTPIEVARTPEDLFQDQAALNAVYNAFSSSQQRIQGGDNPVSDNGSAPTDDGTTEDGADEDGTQEDGTTDDGSGEDGAAEEGAAEEGAAEEGAAEDGAAEDGAPGDGAPGDGGADDGAPDDTGSVDGPGNQAPGDGAAIPSPTGSLLNAANSETLNSDGLGGSPGPGTDAGGGATANPATDGGGDSTNSNAPPEPEPQPEPDPIVNPIPEPEPEPVPPVIDLDGDDSGGTAGNNFAGNFVEGGGPVSIADTDVTITDADDTTIQSATITLVNQPDGGDEGLSVNGSLPSGITAAGSGTGELVLTGSASLAEYQATIAQVQYNNTSSPPDPTDRTITVVVNDGEAESTATSTIIFNDPPTLDLDDDNSSNAIGADFNGSFTEGGGPVSIADTDVTITDADDTTIESATITLTNQLDGGSEGLSVNGSLPTGIAVAGSGPGQIVLTGSASLADYQAAITQIQYNNTSANPTTAARTITVVVNDGDDDSNTATSTISVNALNDAPDLDLDADNSTETGADFAGSFVEGGGPVSITDVDVSIADADDTNIESATITLTNRPDGGDESLSVSGSLPTGITEVAYVPATGVLVLTGSASLADYQAAIAQIQYNNTSANPDAAARTITVVVNDGDDDSNTATATISVSVLNDAPALDLDVGDDTAAGTAFSGTFVEDGGPVDISDGVLITDADDTNIESATITLINRPDGGDESLSVNGSLPTGITASAYNPVTGELVLTGSASLADYQTAIAQIQYDNASADPDTTDRTIEVVVNDGDDDSNTGTATISVSALNDAPDLDLDANDSSTATGADFTGSFVEGGGPVSIADVDVSITEADDTNIESATITLTNRPDGGDENLSVSGSLPTGITEVAYVPATGVLVLTGSATLADYQAAIAQIQYDNASANPDGADRTITVVVNDGDDDSNIATSTISVGAANDAPTLDLDVGDDTAAGTAFAGSFFEDGGPVDISDGVLIADADDTNIESATITLTNIADGIAESLSVNGLLPTGITTTGYNSGSGEIVLTGSASLADYQTAIAQIQYNNTSQGPDTDDRIINVVVNDGDGNSNTAVATVSIIDEFDPPVVDNLDGDSLAYNEGDGPLLLDQGALATVTDVDSPNFDTGLLRARITAGEGTGEDLLSVDTSGPVALSGTATGSTVSVGGVVIGTLNVEITEGNDFSVFLNADATPALVQTLVQALTYENTDVDDPTTGARTIEVSVRDNSDGTPVTADVTVTVAALNDAPSLDLDADDSSTATGAGFNGSFSEGGGPVAIADADVAIADVDDINIESATITLTNRPDDDDESLSVSGSLPTGITAAAYNTATGELVLTGSASLADYQTAIAQIQYDNSNANPDTVDRTIEIVVNDGDDDSNITTSTISVGAANDAPSLDLDGDDDSGASGADFSGFFTEDGGSVAIGDIVDPDIAITDADDTNIESATITLTNRPDDVFESLSVSGSLPSGITASAYSPTTGILTLNGSASLADYQTAIGQIRYNNSDQQPDTANRVITVVVNDGDDDSNVATATITVDGENDLPIIDLDFNNDSGAGGPDFQTSFTEGGGAVSVADTDFAIVDVDDSNLDSARITLINRPDGGDESLSVNGSLPTGITASAYDPGTGVIILTGSASLSDYQTAIRQIEYNNTSLDPDTADRTIEVTVNDGADGDSNVATTTVIFTASNDAPVLDLDADDDSGAVGANFLGSFAEDLGPVAIGDIVDPDITITDADSATLVSATITLTNRPDGDGVESLSISGLLPTGITTTGYNTGNGELILTGTASLADYQTAIGQIRYNNTSQDPAPADRTIEVVVSDGVDDSNTATATISVNPTVDAPVISDLDGDSLAYTEGDGVVVLDQGAQLAVADADSPNFDTGQLVVSITAGGVTLEDVLSIEEQGTGAGQVNTLGLSVRIGTTEIGSVVGGSNGADLQITFNSTATAADVEAVTRAITYENSDTDNPTEGNRDIRFLLSDGDGGTSTPSVVTVTISRENDAPTIQFLSQTRVYNEGQGALVIDNLVPAQISDVDSTDFNGGTMTITITAGGDASEDVLSIQSEAPATDAGNISISGSSIVVGNGTTTDVFATFTGGAEGSDLVITFTSALATPALVSDLAALLTYENTEADNPTGGTRTIEVTVSDGDGGTSAAAASTVNVLVSNDPPVLDDLAGDTLAYSEGDLFQIIDQGTLATVVDPDSGDFDNGVLTVSITNRVLTEDIVSLSTSGTGVSLSAGVALNSEVTVAGQVIGTIGSGGALNQNLVVTFNANADATDVQTVVNAVTYLNSNAVNPDESARTVRFFLTDGDGGSTGNVDTLVTVAGVDDLTSLGGINGDNLVYTEGDGARIIDQGTQITISDGDSADFNGGFVIFQIVSGGVPAEDLLGILAVGDGTGEINISGSTVTYEGNVIGTIQAGPNNVALQVNFTTADATPEAAQALARQITYSNTSVDDPTSGARTVRFIVNSGDNNTGSSSDATITVNAVNEEPTLTATGATLNWTETTAAPTLFSGTTISTVEAGQTIVGFTLEVTNALNTGEELIQIDGFNIFLSDGASGTTGPNSLDFDVSFSGSTATITFTGNISAAVAEALFDNVLWQNTSDDPTASGTTRDVTITEIVDSGGTANGGDDTSEPGVTTTITLTVTNDPTTADLPRAASFGGTTSDFAVVSPLAGLAGTLPNGDFTVSMWINDATTEQAAETYISLAGAGQDNDLLLQKKGGNLHITTNAADGAASVDTGVSIPTDGNWHHYAVTFDVSTGNFQVFIDGVFAGSGTSTGGGLDPNGSLVLGQDQDTAGGGFDADEALTGSLADVALFSGVLTGGTIDTISNGTVNPSSAVTFLRWNDDTGTFEDISPRNNDLTTNGNLVTDTGPVATVTEDGSIVISGIEVSDPDNTSTTVTLSVGNGEISFTGGTTNLTFSDGDGTDGTLTFSGSITAINAALANSIQYSPDADFDGTDTLTVTADDGGGAVPALNLTIPVIPVNDDPVAVADFAEATAISLPSLSDDIDALIVNDFNASGGAGPDRTQLLTNDGSGGLTAFDVGTPDVRGNDVKLGDFDGDGDLDAIVALSNGQDQLLTNQGGAQAGTEGTFVASNLPGGDQQSIGLAVGDVDSDGDLDVIVTHFNNSQTTNVEATLLTNDGSANFAASQLTGTSIQGRDAALADLDGDGDLDAIVVNDASANQLLINQGGTQGGTEGAFNTSTLTGGVRFSVDVVFGDIDGDGDQDALIGNTGGFSQVLTNNGSGVFTVADLSVAGDRQTTAIALGDLDNDGDLDAVIANGTSGEQANQVLINQGGNQGGTEGVFAATDIVGSDGRSSDVALVDIDGDGDLDAFITNNTFDNALDQTNQVLINDGTGTFTPSLLDGGNSASNAIAFGDLDGDGAVAAVGPDGLPNINLSPVRGSVATNDSDVDSASLTYTLDTLVDGLTLATDGSFVFDPTNLAYASLAAGQSTNVVASYTVDDGDGGTDQSTLTITVTGTDDAPTFTGAAASPTFTEGGTAQALFSASAASTVDTGQTITGFTLTVTDVSGTADDRLTVNGFEFSLTDSNTNTPGPNGLGFTVSVDNGTATVVFSGGAVPTAGFETLINGITYANFSQDPTASSATRVVTLTEIVDSGISDGLNQNTTELNIASTVTITPVNDAPDLDLDLNDSSGATGADFNNTFTEGGGSVAIGDGAESDLNISLFDDVNIESATITLTNTPDGAAEFLLVSGGLPGGIVASAYDQLTGVITLTGTASKADYEGALELIRYNNTSANPDSADRIITVVVNDGDDDSNTATTTITINDNPVIANLSAVDLVFNEGDAPLVLDRNTAASVTDLGSADFDGGTLTVAILPDGRNADEDVLGIRDQGTGTGEIGVSGANVTFSGIAIGTFTGGTAANDLVVTLNSLAAPAAVQALIQNLTYDNTEDFDATAGTRTIHVTLADGDGGTTTFSDVEFTEQTGVNNPFDGITVGTNGAAPSFVDIDGDGDLDAFIGAEEALDGGSITAFENTGSSTAPVFTQVIEADNPFGGASFSRTAVIDFVDIDNDGDMDALVGDLTGSYRAFENTGTATDANFVEVTGTNNPFVAFGVDDSSSPVFVDIDNDGDLDMFSGADGGSIDFFENVGSENEPEFVAQSGSNPLSSAGVNSDSVLAFADLDNDGDLDAVIGERGSAGGGPLHVWENTGTVTSPAFTEVTGAASPLNGILIDNGRPAFADIDGDGDLDLFVGNDTGGIQFFENTAASSSASITVTVNAQNDAPIAIIDTASISRNASLSGNVLTDNLPNNDFDPEGDPLTLAFTGRFGTANGGIVSLQTDGSFSYEAPTGFVGLDTFNYAVTDSNGGYTVGYAAINVESALSLAAITDDRSASNADETIVGGGADDELTGGSGDDTLLGGAGNDLLFGGDGNDELRSGGAPQNVSSSWIAQDELRGGAGDDQLFGEGGAVLLIGGEGADTITVNDTGSFFDWAQLSYRSSTGSVVGNFTDTVIDTSTLSNVSVGSINLDTNEVLDGIQLGGTGFGSIDTASGIHVILDGSGDDFFAWDGTTNGSFGNFIEIRLGYGDDVVDFTGAVGTRRISYSKADGGVRIDMTANAIAGSGEATDFGVSSAIGTDTFNNVNYLRGSQYDDLLIGDTLTTAYRTQAGNDTVVGDATVASQNRVDYVATNDRVVVDLSTGIATEDGFGDIDTLINIRNINGSLFDDVITGDDHDNELFGRSGDDTLSGGDGRDLLFGDFGDVVDPVTGAFQISGGDDILIGGDGNDMLFGGDGFDTLFGGAGFDSLNGQDGGDTLVGGAGSDFIDGGDDREYGVRQFSDALDFSQETGTLGVTVDLSSSLNNVVDTFGNTETAINVEQVIGTDLADTLTGGNAENDGFEEFVGRGGNDTINGGTGFDQASYEFAIGGISVDMTLTSNQVSNDGDGSFDDLTSIESIEGSEFDDTVEAPASGFFRVRGRGGDDTIIGNGQTRADYLFAGATFGAVVNLSVLAQGVVAAGTATDGTGGTDTLSGIGSVRGTEFDDTFFGGAADESFRGVRGNDTIDGGGGINTVKYDDFGLSGIEIGLADSGVKVDLGTGTASDAWGDQDTLVNIQNVIGTRFDDVITGNAQDNTLTGGDGNDELFGGAGNDILDLGTAPQDFFGIDIARGGAGDDTIITAGGFAIIIGGAGADTFDINDTGQYFDWVNVSYSTSTQGIAANLTGSTVNFANFDGTAVASGGILDGIATTGNPFGEIDTFAPGNVFHVLRDSPNNDEILWDGTFANSFGSGFVEIRLSAGDDLLDFTGAGGTRRVSYQNADGGVIIDMRGGADGTGTATENGVGSHIGNDNIINTNSLRGSSFDDVFFGDLQTTRFRGSEGSDTINGDAGANNRIEHSDSPDSVVVDLRLGSNQVVNDGFGTSDTLANIRDVRGGDFDDDITGDSGNNLLIGSRGDDTLRGDAGNDTLIGDDGDDTLIGGDDDDFLDGRLGDDELIGGAGRDTLFGGSGDDALEGGADNDILDGDDGDDLFEGGDGDDIIRTGDNTGFGDEVIAGLGEDVIDFETGQGFYTIDYSGLGNAVDIDLAVGGVDKGVSGIDVLLNLENVNSDIGGLGIQGTASADIFVGSIDDQAFVQFRGGAGNDTIFGGSGFFRLDYRDALKGVEVDLANNTTTQDGFDTQDTLLGGIHSVRGSDFDDTLTGDADGNQFIGRGGNDTIDGGDGLDLVRYDRSGVGAVNIDLSLSTDNAVDGLGFVDTLINVEMIRGSRNDGDVIAGSSGDEKFDGRGGDDILLGRAGNDLLIGRDGDDVLIGGDGYDSLRGGSGFNTYVFQSASATIGVDYLLDFFSGDNQLDLSAILGGTGFSEATAGQFVSATSALGNTTIAVDVDGSGSAFGFVDIAILKDVSIVPIGYKYAADGSQTTVSETAVVANAVTGTFSDDNALNGTAAVDTISGLDGSDRLDGGAGDDFLNGGADSDTLIGGAGSDVHDGGGAFEDTGEFDVLDYSGHAGGAITVDRNARTVTDSGTSDVDIFFDIEMFIGTSGDDTFIGGFEFAQFAGLAGADTIDGGDGAFANYQEDANFGGTGAVTVNLSDTQFTSSVTGQTVDAGRAVDGFGDTDTLTNIDFVIGTNVDDEIVGDFTDDWLEGNGGADTIRGGAGNDKIYGATNFSSDTAINTLFGDAGNDQLFGSDGNDVLNGGANDDILDGGAGDDTLDGGAGTDTVSYTTATQSISVDLANGTAVGVEIGSDTIVLNTVERVIGGSGNDTITGDSNDNLIDGGGGSDFLGADAGDDIIDGGGAFDDTGEFDILSYATHLSGAGDSIIVDRAAGTVTDNNSGDIDLFKDIEEILGSMGDDIFNGGGDFIQFAGLAGADTFNGTSGGEFVDYSQDDANGGTGGVTVNLSGAAVTSTVSGHGSVNAGTAIDGFGDTDTLNNVSLVTGTNSGDDITGSGADDLLQGFDGADTIRGGGGNDQIFGASDFSTDIFADMLFGDDGDDLLAGSGGADILDGGIGDDRLSGGDGSDTITTGTGLDVLVFETGETGIDTITDFDVANDILDLSALLDANFDPGNQATYIQANSSAVNGVTNILVDQDGAANGTNFVQIATLDGIGAGSSVDFIDDDGLVQTVVTT